MASIFCPEQGEEIQGRITGDAIFRQAVSLHRQFRYLDALPLFWQAADAGHPQALGYLGWFYENGYYVTRDPAQAAEYYQQASDLGDGAAAGRLALMYDDVTTDFPTNYQKAFQLYSLALSRGAATGTSLNNLAVLYLNGNGTEPNYFLAEKLLQKAIVLGHPLAAYNLAELRQRLSELGETRPVCPRCGATAVPVFRHPPSRNAPMVCQTCGQLFLAK